MDKEDIDIVINADWGCEHTDADGVAYAEFTQSWLAKHGIKASVSFDRLQYGKTVVSCSDSERAYEIESLTYNEIWNDFCANKWRAEI